MFPFAAAAGCKRTGTRPTVQSPARTTSGDDRTGLRVLYPDPSDHRTRGHNQRARSCRQIHWPYHFAIRVTGVLPGASGRGWITRRERLPRRSWPAGVAVIQVRHNSTGLFLSNGSLSGHCRIIGFMRSLSMVP